VRQQFVRGSRERGRLRRGYRIFGYWRSSSAADSYGEHRALSVACSGPAKLTVLNGFLAKWADELKEECVYLQTENKSSLIYPSS
jgi:hypothetical protein